ncbi:MAG: DegV family protein [Candidatus Heimdallarchaeum endolithica]|uniref:DegV family protein n=1 Tax=Candidatus Heimdallarchaeum endolithica TaxID=2876572 RepID=A0A9Y1BR24_9ARCH|nr:MAG: DegV family protein [Candidatus Heimdallarchaeum endolithica]
MKIILDSSCDLPEEYVKKYDIKIAPVSIIMDGKTYRDRFEVTAEEFYAVLREKRENLPTTSGTSPMEFYNCILDCTKSDNSVLVATISSNLSTTWQSANIAIKRFKDKSIHLIDSLSGSGALGLLGLAASKLCEKGEKDEEIIRKVNDIQKKTVTMGYVDDLYNLQKSGRISQFKYYLSNLLNAKPVMRVKDGFIVPLDKARGKIKAIEKLIRHLFKAIKSINETDLDCMITHSDDLETAEYIMNKLDSKLNFNEKIISFLTPALAVHLGIGTIVVSVAPSP